jgi:hypothetical protein
LNTSIIGKVSLACIGDAFSCLHRRCVCASDAECSDDTAPVVRKTISLPSDTWQQVEDYRFGYRIKRETEAIRRLIELGLKAARQQQAAE